MSVPTPHFLLYSSANRREDEGEWSFVLQAADGSATFEAQDNEPELRGERLELLAVVRGLEALEQPSRVTLVTTSKYVRRGIAYGLEEWRGNDWTWESFGEMVPVKNRDLWQRLDRALTFHTLDMRTCRIDPPHTSDFKTPPTPAATPSAAPASQPPRRRRPLVRLWVVRLRREIRNLHETVTLRLRQLGTPWLPKPWIG